VQCPARARRLRPANDGLGSQTPEHPPQNIRLAAARRGMSRDLSRAAVRCRDATRSRFVAIRFGRVPARFRFGRVTCLTTVTPPLTQRGPPNVAQEQFFQRVAQPPHGRRQRQPLHRHDVLHQVAARIDGRLHAPELHDFWPPTRAVGEDAEEFAHAYIVASLFNHFAVGSGERGTTAISGRAPLRTTMPPAA